MRRAGEKLKSSRGASLMMALLLFLVCAVVGSAVLTAGTAASGRMAKIAESDQRYYLVNSTAKLLIDQLDKKTVAVKKVTTGGATPTEKYYIDGHDYDTITDKKLSQELAYQLFTTGSVPSSISISSTNIASEISPSTFPTLTVNYASDRLEFTVSAGTPAYERKVTFAIQKQVIDNHKDETEEILETSYTWKLSGVK